VKITIELSPLAFPILAN